MLDYNKWLTTPAGKKFLQEQHKTKSPSIAGESPLQLDDLLGLGVLTGGYKLGTKLLSKKVTKGFKNNYIPSRNVKGDIFDSRFRRGYEPSINPKSTIKPGTFTDESLKADEARRLWNNEYNKNHPDLEQFNLGEYKQGGLINNNTMKKKMLPKYKFGDWLSNTFDLDTQGASFGDVAADTGMFAANAAMSATPLSIIPAITGKSAASMTGYKNKTGMGENLTGTADTIYGMQAKLAPIGAGIIGNAVAPGIGGPLATAAMTGAQEGYNQIRQSQQQNQVPQMNYNSAPIMNSSPNVNNQYNPTMTKFGGYLKRYDDGGIMEYKGESHEGPNGGIPVNNKGIPVPKEQASALVEGNETRYQPTSQEQPYIFSDSTKISVDKNIIAEAKAVGISVSKDDTYASLSKKINNKLNEYA